MYLTKTQFVNALVREHVAIAQQRYKAGCEAASGYLQIEMEISDAKSCRLIMRGNQDPTLWMMFDTGLPSSTRGVGKAHQLAAAVAFAAASKISDTLGEPATIQLPEVRFFRPWFAEDDSKSLNAVVDEINSRAT